MSASGVEADCARSWPPRPGAWSGPNTQLSPVLFLWEVAYFVLKILYLPVNQVVTSGLFVLAHLILPHSTHPGESLSSLGDAI